MGPWTRDYCFCLFWKLGFCLVSECEIFAHGGQLRILLDHECVASIPTWNVTPQFCPYLHDVYNELIVVRS